MSCNTFSPELGTGDARLRTTACCTFSLLIPIRVVVGVFNLQHRMQTLASLYAHTSQDSRLMVTLLQPVTCQALRAAPHEALHDAVGSGMP